MSDPKTPSDPVLVEMVRLDAPDGSADALVGRPPGDGPFPAVLVYTDAYGIRPSVNAYAQRLASHGYLVLVPNIFYRHGAPPVVPDRAADRLA